VKAKGMWAPKVCSHGILFLENKTKFKKVAH